MGQDYLVVNPAKRQFYDPGKLMVASKFPASLNGSAGRVLAALITDGINHGSSLYGYWLGDPVILAADAGRAAYIADRNAATLGQRHRNLHAMARDEFQDISYYAIIFLVEHSPDDRKDFAMYAACFDECLIDLGNIVFQMAHAGIRAELDQTVGSDWPRRYKDACNRNPHYCRATSTAPLT